MKAGPPGTGGGGVPPAFASRARAERIGRRERSHTDRLSSGLCGDGNGNGPTDPLKRRGRPARSRRGDGVWKCGEKCGILLARCVQRHLSPPDRRQGPAARAGALPPDARRAGARGGHAARPVPRRLRAGGVGKARGAARRAAGLQQAGEGADAPPRQPGRRLRDRRAGTHPSASCAADGAPASAATPWSSASSTGSRSGRRRPGTRSSGSPSASWTTSPSTSSGPCPRRTPGGAVPAAPTHPLRKRQSTGETQRLVQFRLDSPSGGV